MTIKEKQRQLEAYADVLSYLELKLSQFAEDVAMYSADIENGNDRQKEYARYMLDDLQSTIQAYRSIIAPIEYLATH